VEKSCEPETVATAATTRISLAPGQFRLMAVVLMKKQTIRVEPTRRRSAAATPEKSALARSDGLQRLCCGSLPSSPKRQRTSRHGAHGRAAPPGRPAARTRDRGTVEPIALQKHAGAAHASIAKWPKASDRGLSTRRSVSTTAGRGWRGNDGMKRWCFGDLLSSAVTRTTTLHSQVLGDRCGTRRYRATL